MRSTDPYSRTALEVQILAFLNDQPNRHPITLDQVIRGVDPDQKDSIVCTVDDFRREGLVMIQALKGGGDLVSIGPIGLDILTKIYSRQNVCD